MPSAKILSEKQAYVADLKAKFESAVSGCVVAYGGINVENDTKLRKELREAGVDYMVVKNTMLRLAVKGTALEGLAENFKGDTAVAFAHEDDPMAAARILCKYQDGDKSKKFVVKAGFMDFDVVVTTPDMMGRVGRLGKVLGPRGLMPNPKAGTVAPDLGKAVSEAKAGKIEYRLDKQNIIHVPVGKASFGAEKLYTNLDTVMEAIAKAKPAAAKGTYFKSATIATTMGPGIRLNTLKYGV